MLSLIRKIVALSAVLGVLLAASPAWADYFIWQDQCTSANWYACCEIMGDYYGNWSLTPQADCAHLTYPGPADDVDLVEFDVYLDQSAAVWSLVSGGPFQLLNGDVPGSLEVHTTATFNHLLYFDEGALIGVADAASTFDVKYAAEIRSSTYKEITQADFNVWGAATVIVTGSGNIGMGYGAVLTVRPLALFELQTDASIVNNPYAGGYAVENEGLFRKTIATGVSEIQPAFNNTGTVEVLSGTLRLAGGGTSTGAHTIAGGAVLELAEHTLGPGVTFDGDGSVRVASPGFAEVATGADITIPNLELAGAYSQTTGGGDLTVGTTLTWLGGGFDGTGTTTIGPGCTGTMSGGDTKTVVFGTLQNAGALTWSDTGGLYLTYGGLTNLAGGTFSIETDANVSSGGGGSLTNAGTLVKVASAGETDVGVPCANTGTVDVQSGRLSFYDFTQTAGLTKLDGGDLGAPGSTLKVLGGILTGTGDIFGHVLNDGGEVRPGSSPGTIVITGDYGPSSYTQSAAGTLTMEVAGHTPGTEYDQLLVSGWAFLDGTINVGLSGGFVPDAGDSFVLLTYAGHSGQFATVNLPGAVSTRRFGLFVEPTSTVLRVALRGDLNCDGTVNFGDINPFVLLLSNPSAWQVAFPTCPLLSGDINGDGTVGFGDINPFVALLSS